MFQYFSQFARARRRLMRARAEILVGEQFYPPERDPLYRRIRKIPVQTAASKSGIDTVDRDGFGKNQLIVFNPKWVLRASHDSLISELYRAYF